MAYGIVVVSPAFISKKWLANELAGLFALETKERKVILPIWHNVTHEQVLEFNTIFADRKAIPSTKPLEEMVFAIEFATGVTQRVKEISFTSPPPWEAQEWGPPDPNSAFNIGLLHGLDFPSLWHSRTT